MILLTTTTTAQKSLAENVRAKRLQMDLTQEGLAKRSGVPLPTIRKFEQKGSISLESFLKIQMVLGGLEAIVNATNVTAAPFTSIDEVLKFSNKPTKKRGRYK